MKEKIKELVNTLNRARQAYYGEDREIMSNKEYDKLFDELVALEKQTGIILPDSPTNTVGMPTVVSALKKVSHETPALSLDKLKVTEKGFEEKVTSWVGEQLCVLSFKLDGLTVVATYDDGKLTSAVTRGNGHIGEDITHNAKYFKGLPQTIPYEGHLVVRGEATIGYSEFDRINASLPAEEAYMNPRNLASGTVRALNSSVCAERTVTFTPFEVVTPVIGENAGLPIKYLAIAFELLKKYGFSPVPYKICNKNSILSGITEMSELAKTYDTPTDGLVLAYDDIAYSRALGSTGHHNKGSIAIKWADETASTRVVNIDYTTTRTGIISQVAEFEPVELCGTIVSRALIPNLNYRADLDIKIGDRINVYKANMIIPVIDSNDDADNTRIKVINDTVRYGLPEKCPCCGGIVSINTSNSGVMNMYCNNPYCSARQTKSIAHLCERDCLNIVGLSEKKINFLLNKGYITDKVSLFAFAKNPNPLLANEPGWDEKSVKNLVDAVNKAKSCDFVSFIHAMGIPNVGKGQAKLLKKYLESNYDKLTAKYPNPDADGSYDLLGLMVAMYKGGFDWTLIEGFGEVIAAAIDTWIEDNLLDSDTDTKRLLKYLCFTDKKPEALEASNILAGKTFVITGDVHIYKNRAELQAKIESLGGKAAGSVSSKTSYLINNDVNSTSGKNKKAKELNIPIISEEDFEAMIR